jgi:hypothetical protein
LTNEQERKSRNPWPLVVLGLIVLTIVVIVLRLWDVVLVLFVLLLINMSWRLRSRSRAPGNGAHMLVYSWKLTWTAIIGAIVLASMIILVAASADPVEYSQTGEDFATGAVMMMSFFVILVWPMFIESTFSWFVIDSRGIDSHSAWRRRLFLPWDEVESITVGNKGFVIKGKKGIIRLQPYLVGLDRFAKAVKELVPEERWTPVKETIELLASVDESGIDHR